MSIKIYWNILGYIVFEIVGRVRNGQVNDVDENRYQSEGFKAVCGYT